MPSLNVWRACKNLHIESACLLIAGIDPRSILPELSVMGVSPIESNAGDTDSVKTALRFSIPNAQEAASWLTIARQAVIDGNLTPSGKVRLWKDGFWKSVDPADLSSFDSFDFDVTRSELYRWLLSLGWTENELPEFLAGTDTAEAGNTEGEELRALEALGLLVETFAKRAPKYQVNPESSRAKPNRSQIAEAMSAQAGEVSGMGKRKLQDLLTDALDAWEKKRG